MLWIISLPTAIHIPAEVRVAIALLECSSVQKVANHLNISPYTVRTHLKHIFTKLNINPDSELYEMKVETINHEDMLNNLYIFDIESKNTIAEYL